MQTYLVSLGLGVLVGIVYGVFAVRSPAPPVVALVGLLGMLLGEQVPPMTKRLLAGYSVDVKWAKTDCVPHIFGELPKRSANRVSNESEVRS
jgi:XapX domain-containing protein